MSNDVRTAVVTGAGQGIGRAIAGLLAEEGCAIAAIDAVADGANSAAEELTATGARAKAYVCDVTDGDAVTATFKEINEEFGSVDVLVNNAGITRDGLVLRMSDADWDAVVDVNLKGTFLCTRAAAKYMLKQRRGSIVNVASIIGVVGNAGQANYAASKAGIIGLTKSCAKEFASRGIRANAIAPGFIETKMTEALDEEVQQKMLDEIPLKRFGTVEDVARVVAFLAGDAASYVTGEVIQIDGGLAI